MSTESPASSYAGAPTTESQWVGTARPTFTPLDPPPTHSLTEQQKFSLIRSLLGDLGADNLGRVVRLAEAQIKALEK